uniref:Uncharacterized protein n=1 Tax=Triticum urartu TaxID=4572 RepID=A0A8R7Q9F5_TRIUA
PSARRRHQGEEPRRRHRGEEPCRREEEPRHRRTTLPAAPTLPGGSHAPKEATINKLDE